MIVTAADIYRALAICRYHCAKPTDINWFHPPMTLYGTRIMIPLLQVRKVAARTLVLIPQVLPLGWGDSHGRSRSNELVLSWELQKASVGTEQGDSLGGEGGSVPFAASGVRSTESHHVLSSYLSLICTPERIQNPGVNVETHRPGSVAARISIF